MHHLLYDYTYEKQSMPVSNEKFLTDPSMFKKLVGKLLYLTITRHCLSSELLKPIFDASRHFRLGIKILKYFKNASGKDILYKRNVSLMLNDFCDAKWTDCPITKKSITSFSISRKYN